MLIRNAASWSMLSLTLSLVACSDAPETVASAKLPIDATAAIVIRQIYGGGSNSSAAFAHDFIELFNRSQSAVSISGWSLQYASASGTGNFGATSAQLTELPEVTLEPGQSFLVQEAGTGAVGALLPEPDHVDPTPINLSASAGKVTLVRSVASLGCNGSSSPCSAAAEALIVDLVGYGGANYAEGSPALAANNATALIRQANGCVDTNVNAADFYVATPIPVNSASPYLPCNTDPGTGAGGGAGVGGSSNLGGDNGIAGAPEPGSVRIRDIQGRAHRSPLEGTVVARVPGVVTHVVSNGFYFQDPTPDMDPSTSEGLFVFTGSNPTVTLGDTVLVTGPVTEYRPGCSNCSADSGGYGNLTVSEIERPTRIFVLGKAEALPEPVLLGPGGRMPPSVVIDDDGASSVESNAATFSVDSDGIDFYESLEGMRVRIDDAVAVGPTNGFGELPVLASRGAGVGPRSSRGGIVVLPNDFNPERVILDGDDLPEANVGDYFVGSVVGILDYSFGNYKLNVTSPLPALGSGELQPEQVQFDSRAPNELDIASLNVENLDPADPPEKFAALARIVVDNLGAPDILSLEEVQDDSGAVNDGIVTAQSTIRSLADAIVHAGGPVYEWRSIDPLDGRDGGEPGGNIRVGVFFRVDRRLKFVDRSGGTATTATGVVAIDGVPQLTLSPGRIDPTSTAFANSRKPLVAEFEFNGQRLFVIANHFNSKGGDQPLFGRFQPPARSSETQRLEQARQVAAFVDQIRAVDDYANVIVLGDLNDFEFSPTLAVLEASDLTTLVRTLPVEERYSYVFDGNSQVLDHILASPALKSGLRGFDIVHVNAEFAKQSSDHDPPIARFAIGPLPGKPLVPRLDCVGRYGPLRFVVRPPKHTGGARNVNRSMSPPAHVRALGTKRK